MAYEEGLTDRIIRLFFPPPFHEGPLLSEADFVPCSMHEGRIKREVERALHLLVLYFRLV